VSARSAAEASKEEFLSFTPVPSYEYSPFGTEIGVHNPKATCFGRQGSRYRGWGRKGDCDFQEGVACNGTREHTVTCNISKELKWLDQVYRTG